MKISTFRIVQSIFMFGLLILFGWLIWIISKQNHEKMLISSSTGDRSIIDVTATDVTSQESIREIGFRYLR